MKQRIFIFAFLLVFLFTSACSLAGVGAPAAPTDLPRLTIIPPTRTTEPVTSTPPAPTQTPVQVPLTEQFDLALAQALQKHDFDALRRMMKARFSFATLDVNLLEVSAEEAIEALRQDLLAQGSVPAPQFQADLSALLGGKDPLAQWGPNASPLRAMHVTGLSPEADEEAVLVISRDPATGEFFWHGILLPQAGLFSRRVPGADEVQVTDVQSIEALEIIYVRIGPGTEYDQVGAMRQGEVAAVTGKSLDGLWWRIYCTQLESHLCWVSADPELTRSVPAP